MRVRDHTVVSGILAGSLYAMTRSVAGAAACLAAGVLVDLDHVLDYLIDFGWPLRCRHFFEVFGRQLMPRVFVLLHAWELVPVLFLTVLLVDWHPVAVGAFVGFLSHMMMDQLFNVSRPGSYFLTFRIRHRFSASAFLEGHRDRKPWECGS